MQRAIGFGFTNVKLLIYSDNIGPCTKVSFSVHLLIWTHLELFGVAGSVSHTATEFSGTYSCQLFKIASVLRIVYLIAVSACGLFPTERCTIPADGGLAGLGGQRCFRRNYLEFKRFCALVFTLASNGYGGCAYVLIVFVGHCVVRTVQKLFLAVFDNDGRFQSFSSVCLA